MTKTEWVKHDCIKVEIEKAEYDKIIEVLKTRKTSKAYRLIRKWEVEEEEREYRVNSYYYANENWYYIDVDDMCDTLNYLYDYCEEHSEEIGAKDLWRKLGNIYDNEHVVEIEFEEEIEEIEEENLSAFYNPAALHTAAIIPNPQEYYAALEAAKNQK